MSSRRAGHTVLELLVVVTIIAVIAAFGAAAYFKTLTVYKASTSEQQLKTLHTILERHRKAVIDDARAESIPQAVLDLAGGDQNRARVIWIKLRLKQQFPQSYAQALQPASGYIAPEPAYLKIITRSNANDARTESAAC
jgi:prepilin-type N-terminal cleavage/methylation domain-containing protein